MDNRGRHVASGSSAFIRDLVVMGVGIVIVGVLLYGGLSLLAGLGSDGEEVTASPGTATTSTEPTSTAAETTTTTSSTTTTTAPTTTTTILQLRPPGEITVIVLNSTGRSGIAGALTNSIAQLGYETLPATNYEQALTQSIVWHVPELGAEAVELAERAIPDATTGIYEGPDLGADIVVVLGASYGG